MRRFAWLSFSVLSLSVSARAERRVPCRDVAEMLERAFSGTRAHLHEDVSRAGEKVPGSFVELSGPLGGHRYEFSIPEQTMDLGAAGQARYRVSDVGLERVSVRCDRESYVVTLHFEDNGVEIYGKQKGGMMDLRGAVPNIQMSEIALELAYTPGMLDGVPALKKGTASFKANINAEGGAASMLGDSLNDLTGYKEKIRAAVEEKAQAQLTSPEVLRAINSYLKHALAKAGIRGAVRLDGADVIVSEGLKEEPTPSHRERDRKRKP